MPESKQVNVVKAEKPFQIRTMKPNTKAAESMLPTLFRPKRGGMLYFSDETKLKLGVPEVWM